VKYTITRPNPLAAIQVRIRKASAGDWLPVLLLVWVMLDHIHRLDWPQLRVFKRLREGRN
jgi:hypothetical protein